MARQRKGARTERQLQKPAHPGRSLSWKKKLPFSVVVTVAFLTLLELGLFALGVRPSTESHDPFVGFAGYRPLFVDSDDGSPGRWTTAAAKLSWFNEQEFLTPKPKGTYRIFCLGGSTTYGRPYDDGTSFCGWLREFLSEADPSRNYEVVNAGGISYASYRVARVMEELTSHDPDLFIVYTGHNEFLEARTYGRLRKMPRFLRDLGGALTRTCIYTALARLSRVGDELPESSPSALLPVDVKTRLDSSVGLDAYRRDAVQRRRVVEHYRFNLEEMIRIARRAGAKLLFVTPASNLADCSPFKSQPSNLESPAWPEVFAQVRQAVDGEDWEQALEWTDRALAIDRRHAEMWYLRGRALLALEKFSEARQAFVRARDEDVCPLRAPSELRDAVLEVARESQVPIVDFADLADRWAEQGIPGEDLFLDHVHPTIDTNRRLALLILEELVRQGIVDVDPTWGDAARREVADRIMSRVDRDAQAMALRNLSKVLAWAGKAEEADRLARRAAELNPDDAETLYQLANSLLREDRVDRAIETYRECLKKEPQYALAYYGLGVAADRKQEPSAALAMYRKAVNFDPTLVDAHFNLANLLRQQGDRAGAARHYREVVRLAPEDSGAHNNLGILLAQSSDWQGAQESFQRALQLNPRSADIHINLGRVLVECGDRAAAEAHFREALKYDPRNADAKKLLEQTDPSAQ